jgi:predicted RNA-binding Zn ribbon-like protein
METPRNIEEMEPAGGDPALDFVDTVVGLRDTEPAPEDELLRSYEDLVTLGLKTRTLAERAARRLRRAARENPAEAQAVLDAAREARDVLDSVFRPVAVGAAPPARALDELARLDATALAHGRLVEDRGRVAWSWDDAPGLDAPLWPLVHSAVELVTTGPLDRVSCCGRCRWLFVDATKNHSRRWCSMEACGTLAKMERYVARRRELRAAASAG